MTEVWFIVLVLQGVPTSVLSPLPTRAECESIRSRLEQSTKTEFQIYCVRGEK